MWTRWGGESGSCSQTSSLSPGETTAAAPPRPPTVSATPGEKGAAVHTKEMLELLVRTEDHNTVASPVLTLLLSFRRCKEAERRRAKQAARGTAEEDRGNQDETAECKFYYQTLQQPPVYCPLYSSGPLLLISPLLSLSYLITLTSILL